ncbi:MAG TPA: amino acid adenylation domain-containing protein [Polyangiaceae bacterium]|nr:amino acid adenylation domain-containing protein [Polyangiaceae bacterium]
MALVHEQFERHAARAPGATALRFGAARLSYAELNVKANQLARFMAKRGVEREERVVVCVEPGFEIAIALLAILKAGAVYVPIDPSYPAARIQIMLEDTAPALLLTHSDLAGKLELGNLEVVQLDRQQAELDGLAGQNLDAYCELEQAAYVYYTSGTTGVPKGVMASHANLASYIGSAQKRYGFTSSDIGPALARFSFSISLFELLSPLVAGGTLILLERAHVLDFVRLSRTLAEVTFFHAGPSLLRGLLKYIQRHHGDFSAFAAVRHASSGGDMVPVEVLEGLRDVFFNAEVFVIYGCSEISCMGCTYPVPRDVPLHKTYVGKPFDGMVVRVVDDELGEVAPGMVGEVLFAGPGVVKGYLDRPELTAEKFIGLDGMRFYRTGDRGRFSDEGLLELLGRSDFQVKLGGIRIELGEVEHHLRRAPGVDNGVVIAKEVGGGEKMLVAYVVPGEGADPDSAIRSNLVRRYLMAQLPDYMVPSIYVELAALPLNHNMKIDRKALPDPAQGSLHAAAAPAQRQPQSPSEQSMAALWRRTLGVERVGLDDNFFDLGGTSLLALQLLVAIDAELGVTLTGIEILREPLEMLAELCDRRSGNANGRHTRVPSPDVDTLELFHFGPQQSLYGALHTAPGAAPRHAVLICAPLGHEYVRSHFILQRLARTLAAQGTPVLRFDYYGCQDSLGHATEAGPGRWRRDIIDAYQGLERRAQVRCISALGVRLGATLLAEVAEQLDLERVVLWDPIEHGAAYHAELRSAHRRYLRQHAHVSIELPAWRGNGHCELLGTTYTTAALRELRALALQPLTSTPCRVSRFKSDCDWLDLVHLEDMLPDRGISKALTTMLEPS